MSKIICDVCGTTYAETAAQCPICGCVRPADADAVNSGESRSYTHVKGGRFSKANVRKRNRANGGSVPEYDVSLYEDEDEIEVPEVLPEKRSSRGPVIVALILLLAIVAVVIYISLRFFGPMVPNETTAATNQTTATSASTVATIPCSAITLNATTIELSEVGEARMLYVTITPADSTDEVIFSSSNASVATVTQTGKVTATGAGEAIITVKCGDLEETCVVTCLHESSTDNTTEPSTEPAGQLTFNRNEFTLLYKGETWSLYTGTVAADEVTFTSDDTSVATIQAGIVTAVGEGTTQVHAEFGEQKITCKVICNFDDVEHGVGGSGGVTEDGGGNGTASGTYKIHSQFGEVNYEGVPEATIRVGDVLELVLRDASGNVVSRDFSVGNSSCCSVSGNSITGVASGSTTITFAYNGQSYTCTIFVS